LFARFDRGVELFFLPGYDVFSAIHEAGCLLSKILRALLHVLATFFGLIPKVSASILS